MPMPTKQGPSDGSGGTYFHDQVGRMERFPIVPYMNESNEIQNAGPLRPGRCGLHKIRGGDMTCPSRTSDGLEPQANRCGTTPKDGAQRPSTYWAKASYHRNLTLIASPSIPTSVFKLTGGGRSYVVIVWGADSKRHFVQCSWSTPVFWRERDNEPRSSLTAIKA
ncbi:uncharacterized protein EI90DRAFT_3284598 [Cantharellus anzutake]|uniref:uncharacterized protein n=1 Tax=Cantharellus anzutake TaxID=1750568 RepID=UPI0019051865|nr:uncharacterized protein EI90DRAFT_3284598 [Cantharellus anzutake]KAF8344143.1 hypothetical protein EI90DRAFT_3284598 [Cantharellus anzutake]